MVNPKPLTVVQALPALNSGGVERGTLEIADALVRRGHRSIVISAGGSMVEELVKKGSEHFTMSIGEKSLPTYKFIRQLRSFLRGNKVAILHARSRLPAWICYFAQKGLSPQNRAHFVTTVHGLYSVNRYSKIMVSGERVIAISNFISKYIFENYPDVNKKNIVTIPRGVSEREFSYGHQPLEDWLLHWQKEYPKTIGKFLITLPARLTRRKGQTDLLRIIKLLEKDERIHGLIVGGHHPGKENYLYTLKNMVKKLGLEEKISFTGHREDIKEVMSISDVVLSLSTKPEAFGRAPLEALSLGIPVIGYGHGGASEVLQTIFPMGVIPVGDIETAAMLISSFMSEKPPVPRQNIYTLDQMQTKTVDLYESLAINLPASRRKT